MLIMLELQNLSYKATRIALWSQFYPNKWADDLIKGFGIKLGGADNQHKMKPQVQQVF